MLYIYVVYILIYVVYILYNILIIQHIISCIICFILNRNNEKQRDRMTDVYTSQVVYKNSYNLTHYFY